MRLVLWAINNDTVYKLKAKVIAGAANNQLADEMFTVPFYKRHTLCT
jgi:glutamate dehydrogenase/leucine dehydrogenase